ncbi:hypothetical protein B0I08_101335 [Glaciihabitans tibetensis]|uniref:Uncharacterized protein n=1 Tax=Glaciihabitans tibetensis TaxID=1266600 RepID=A0A2T0VJ23_9MICO|nr:hypothetical protein B0I08_101335 [Glaciihabitans tibetensis]
MKKATLKEDHQRNFATQQHRVGIYSEHSKPASSAQRSYAYKLLKSAGMKVRAEQLRPMTAKQISRVIEEAQNLLTSNQAVS